MQNTLFYKFDAQNFFDFLVIFVIKFSINARHQFFSKCLILVFSERLVFFVDMIVAVFLLQSHSKNPQPSHKTQKPDATYQNLLKQPVNAIGALRPQPRVKSRSYFFSA